MTQRTKTVRRYVTLIACWGNDDADSTIKISPRQWSAIQAGESYERGAWGYYEGGRQHVLWSFEDRLVSVFPSDSDGGEHIVDAPLDELIVQEQ